MSQDLQILGAAWGLLNVTNIVVANVNRSTDPQTLTILASNAVFTDGWPGTAKSLTVIYRYGSTGGAGVATATEGNTLVISSQEYAASVAAADTDPPKPLTVYGATFGPGNVTSTVQGFINQQTQSLSFTANDQTFGDTWEGTEKSFVIVAAYENEVPFLDVITEGTAYFVKYRPRLAILNAYWGLVDVSDVVRANIAQRSITMTASNTALGTDGWPGVAKTLDVVYQYGNEMPLLAAVQENNTLSIDYVQGPTYAPPVNPGTISVMAAAFGPGDVTATVRGFVQAGALSFTADDATFGDTWPGTQKSFSMTYRFGPSSPISGVWTEGSSIGVVAQLAPRAVDFTSIAGLISSGDELQIQAFNGGFVTLDTTQQLVATAPTAATAETFTYTGTASAGTLQAEDESYVYVGTSGTLYTGATLDNAAQFTILFDRAGSFALAINGSTKSFAAVTDGNAIVASGSNTPLFGSAFSLLLEPTQAGFDSLVARYGLTLDEPTDLPSLALLQVIWDLTGGWFAAIGLGPLINTGVPRTGILALIQSSPTAMAALNALKVAVYANPGKSITVACAGFVTVLYNEGLLWAILRFVLNLAKWWAIAGAIKLVLEWTLLPEAAFAELVASLAVWGYTTTIDIIAWSNSASMSTPEAIPV